MRHVTIGTVPNCLCNFIKKRDGNCSEFHQLLQRTLAEKKWAVPTIRQPVKKEIRSGNSFFFFHKFSSHGFVSFGFKLLFFTHSKHFFFYCCEGVQSLLELPLSG
jgi:hypothetical protein